MIEDEMVGWHHQLNGHVFASLPLQMETPGHAEACEWGAGVWVLCLCAGFDSKGAGGGVSKITVLE